MAIRLPSLIFDESRKASWKRLDSKSSLNSTLDSEGREVAYLYYALLEKLNGGWVLVVFLEKWPQHGNH